MKLGLYPAYKGISNDCELIQNANGFRLPFESEWELVANKSQHFFKYAGSNNLNDVGWYGGIFGDGNVRNKSTQMVGQKKPNGFGLFDMSGNVWEWCADDYYVPGHHRQGATERVSRGGSWYNLASNCEVSSRNKKSPFSRSDCLGFRLCRVAY